MYSKECKHFWVSEKYILLLNEFNANAPCVMVLSAMESEKTYMQQKWTRRNNIFQKDEVPTGVKIFFLMHYRTDTIQCLPVTFLWLKGNDLMLSAFMYLVCIFITHVYLFSTYNWLAFLTWKPACKSSSIYKYEIAQGNLQY